jgi:hypothetical protein
MIINTETRNQKVELLERIINAISDEIATADFPNKDQWLQPLKKFRQELYEEVDYLKNL